MKNASEYAKRLRRLLASLRGSSGKAPRPSDGNVSDGLVPALLRRNASESAAAAGYRRLCEATVDLNDLRVTPIPEIAEILGTDFPDAPAAAESIARTLASVFNRCHHLDLDFLRNMGRREAREYVESLDGMTRFTAALFCLRALGQHAAPLDEHGMQWLRQQNLIDAKATEDEVQAFLERSIPPGQMEVFLSAIKRIAAPQKRTPRAAAKKSTTAKKSTSPAARKPSAKKSRPVTPRRAAAKRPRSRPAAKRRTPRAASRRR